MSARLNGILTTLAQQHAYHLLQDAPSDDSRLLYLANGLAKNGMLVMVADVPANNFDFLMRSWLDSYHRLYDVIAGNLFPMYSALNLGMADQMRPPIVVLHGQAAAVIQMLAGYIVPYVAMRQQTQSISDAEIRGLVTYILEDLAADDLERQQYDMIWRHCSRLIRQLITLPIQQYSLTTMKRPLFQQTHRIPQTMPKKAARPLPPSTSPETGSLNPDEVNGDVPDKAQPNQEKTQPLPIWFNFDDSERLPPVPRMPKQDE